MCEYHPSRRQVTQLNGLLSEERKATVDYLFMIERCSCGDSSDVRAAAAAWSGSRPPRASLLSRVTGLRLQPLPSSQRFTSASSTFLCPARPWPPPSQHHAQQLAALRGPSRHRTIARRSTVVDECGSSHGYRLQTCTKPSPICESGPIPLNSLFTLLTCN